MKLVFQVLQRRWLEHSFCIFPLLASLRRISCLSCGLSLTCLTRTSTKSICSHLPTQIFRLVPKMGSHRDTSTTNSTCTSETPHSTPCIQESRGANSSLQPMPANSRAEKSATDLILGTLVSVWDFTYPRGELKENWRNRTIFLYL